MNSGQHQLKSFLTNHNLDQIIVPEIQRDYVWSEENVTNLLESIKLNSVRHGNYKQTVSEEQLNQLPSEAREILIRGFEDKKQYCNVGFIYAYSDPELAGRFILIDGQQRMTTLFLLLLSVCVKEKQQEHFKRSYFQNDILKFDYKVREEAHEFLIHFVSHILSGSSLESVKDQHWYYQEYENDSTINSIWSNYKIIQDFVKNNELLLDYIEGYIEFWYFDTNKSKQGEELYIYVNSRGESVSSNESIKANLLKGLSEQEKHNWGRKWEKWQDLFWKNRGSNLNTDKGFEEFLKWIKYTEYTKDNLKNDIQQQAQINKLRSFKESKKVTNEYFSLQIIENYFTALNTVVKHQNEINFNSKWLEGNTDAVDYIWLIPMMMYAEKFPDCQLSDLRRYSRFFYNIARFEVLSKSPYQALISVITLTYLFLKSDYKDVTDLIEFRSNKSFDNILTFEETIKLMLYKNQNDPNKRIKIEELFWDAEDYKYCHGKISFLWEYIDFQPSLDSIGIFDFDKFKELFVNFKLLYDKPDDILRRALLTKGNYSTYDGRTSTLDGDRYSFIAEVWRWREQFPNKNRAPIYKALIQDFSLRRQKNFNLSRDEILKNIISDFLATYSATDWKYYLIKEPDVLDYCRKKFICFSGNLIYLLRDRNAAQINWKKLEKFLKLE